MINKIILLLAVFAVFSCKNKTENSNGTKPKEKHPTTEKPYSVTELSFDYELSDVTTGKHIVLVNQDLPSAPDCILKLGDTLRLCKQYGQSDWHVESYYDGLSEVDHCEEMRDAILILIKKVNYHHKE